MHDSSLVDVFFIITGIAVIIISVLLAVALVYVIIFVRTVKEVARTAQRATEFVTEDFANLRENIRKRGFNLGAVLTFISSLRRRKISPKTKK